MPDDESPQSSSDVRNAYAAPAVSEDAPTWPTSHGTWKGGWGLVIGVVLSLAVVIYALLPAAVVATGLSYTLGDAIGVFALFLPLILLPAIALLVRGLHHLPRLTVPTTIVMVMVSSMVGYVLYLPVCVASGLAAFTMTSGMGDAIPALFAFGFTFVVTALAVAVIMRLWVRNRAGPTYGEPEQNAPLQPSSDNDDSPGE